MPRIKRPRIGSFIHKAPPGARTFVSDLIDYSNRKKRVYAAHLVVTLCRFGRWLSWALFPNFRFFPVLTDQVDGAMSWEMKAQLTLRPNPQLPILAAVGIMPILAMRKFGVKKGA